MRKIKKLISVIIFLVLLQACSKNNFDQNKINIIINNIKLDSLTKVNFESEENKIVLYTEEELINDEDFKTTLSKVTIESTAGTAAFLKPDITESIKKLEIISINDNKFFINLDNPNEIYSDIKVAKYSQKFFNYKIQNFSNNIIKFNNIVGRLEIDLENNIKDNNRITELNSILEELELQIGYFKQFDYKNINKENTSVILKEILIAENHIKIINESTNYALGNNQAYFISNKYLNINELDKISRKIVEL